VVHVSGRRVCVAAERPVPGVGGFYFEVRLEEVGGVGREVEKGEQEEEEVGEIKEVVEVEEQVAEELRFAKEAVKDLVEISVEASVETGAEKQKRYPEMAIGFCTLGGAALQFPGWEAVSDSPTSAARSWAYHSDTGGVYSSLESSKGSGGMVDEELRYGVGDTVGCGVDLGKGEIWFTKNGVKLEKVIKGELEGRLFPVVGLHGAVCFETNFGGEGDGEFRWKPEVEGEEGGKQGVVMEVAVLGGRGEAEKGAAVQVTSNEVV
jgi:hypothetical protein